VNDGAEAGWYEVPSLPGHEAWWDGTKWNQSSLRQKSTYAVSQPQLAPVQVEPNPGVPQGWYPDPTNANFQRLWDGRSWTTSIRPSESSASYPLVQQARGPAATTASPNFVNPRTIRMDVTRWVLIGSWAAALVGLLLPWVSATVFGTDISATGLDTDDGKLCGILLLLALAFGVLGFFKKPRAFVILSLLASLLIAVVAIYDTANGTRLISASGLQGVVHVGPGLYIVSLAGIVAVIANIVEFRKPSRRY
jgi:hypothetical protein